MFVEEESRGYSTRTRGSDMGKPLDAMISDYIRDLESTMKMDSPPEGDLGWRHNIKASIDTLRAMLANSGGVVEVPLECDACQAAEEA
jgi:hypothetical protein